MKRTNPGTDPNTRLIEAFANLVREAAVANPGVPPSVVLQRVVAVLMELACILDRPEHADLLCTRTAPILRVLQGGKQTSEASS